MDYRRNCGVKNFFVSPVIMPSGAKVDAKVWWRFYRENAVLVRINRGSVRIYVSSWSLSSSLVSSSSANKHKWITWKWWIIDLRYLKLNRPALACSCSVMSRSQEEQPNYSEKYSDDSYEYRHVHLPKSWIKLLPDDRHLLSEAEWRALGVCQSRGWEHYMHVRDVITHD